MKYTLVLNNNYIPIGIVDSRRAFKNVYTDAVHLISTYKDGSFRSTTQDWEIPSVIRSRNFVKLPFTKSTLSKQNILKRDNHTCVYCGSTEKSKLTVDHVLPRSRGGKNSWTNLVACCFSCNNLKDNKTPAEMGWDHPNPQHPHYLVLMNSFTSHIPDEWKDYLFV